MEAYADQDNASRHAGHGDPEDPRQGDGQEEVDTDLVRHEDASQGEIASCQAVSDRSSPGEDLARTARSRETRHKRTSPISRDCSMCAGFFLRCALGESS